MKTAKEMHNFCKKDKFENENSDKLYNLIYELVFKLKRNGASSGHDDYSKLEELKQLKDKGVITQREFDLKKKQILGI